MCSIHGPFDDCFMMLLNTHHESSCQRKKHWAIVAAYALKSTFTSEIIDAPAWNFEKTSWRLQFPVHSLFLTFLYIIWKATGWRQCVLLSFKFQPSQAITVTLQANVAGIQLLLLLQMMVMMMMIWDTLRCFELVLLWFCGCPKPHSGLHRAQPPEERLDRPQRRTSLAFC